jgi:SAM-dependent methyltransferase
LTSVEFVNAIRTLELETVIEELPPHAKLLEIGAGTGVQALELDRRGFDVTAIDLPSSNYREQRLWPIVDYDGRHIPFPDGAFDVVFSSNVLEHVADLPALHAEIRRVLKPAGECVHILPTHHWRLWTTGSAFAAAAKHLVRSRSGRDLRRAAGSALMALRQKRHGERGNLVTEYWYFRPGWWRRNFRDNGFEIVSDRPMGMFYTANDVLGSRLAVERRRRWARLLGSATHLFRLRKKP